MLPRIYGENLFDDIFDDSFFTGHDPLFGKNGRNLMKTDVRETDDAKSYRLSIDLPGFKKDEIVLDLKDGYLTVSAAKGHWTRMRKTRRAASSARALRRRTSAASISAR